MSRQTQFLDEQGLNELWLKICKTFPSVDGKGATGNWGINISGNADSATMLTTNAGSSSKPIYFSEGKPKVCDDLLSNSISGNAASATKLVCTDITTSRGEDIVPSSTPMGVTAVFKEKTATGLTAQYQGIIVYRPYGSESDWSGGSVHNIAFDDYGIYHRRNNGNEWTDWSTILTSSNRKYYAASTTHTHFINISSTTDEPNESQVLVSTGSHKHQTDSHNGHTHTFTPEGTITVNVSNPNVTSGGASSANTTSVSQGTHTHTMVENGAHFHYFTPMADITSTFKGKSATSDTPNATIWVASESHEHTMSKEGGFTPSGSVILSGSVDSTGCLTISAAFAGVAVQGHTHTTDYPSNIVNVATHDHTHSVTANGSVTSSFDPIEAETTTDGGHSHTINASSSVVSVPTMSHTHTVTTDVSATATFTGTQTSTDNGGTHSHTAQENTTNRVYVPDIGHTHTFTITGDTRQPQ